VAITDISNISKIFIINFRNKVGIQAMKQEKNDSTQLCEKIPTLVFLLDILLMPN